MTNSELDCEVVNCVLEIFFHKITKRRDQFKENFPDVTGQLLGASLIHSDFSPGAARFFGSSGATGEYYAQLRYFDRMLRDIRVSAHVSDIQYKVGFLDAQFKDWRQVVPDAVNLVQSRREERRRLQERKDAKRALAKYKGTEYDRAARLTEDVHAILPFRTTNDFYIKPTD